MVLSSPEAALAPGQLLRILEDPSLGDRWLLCRDLEHPGGPGRLLQLRAERSGAVKRSPVGPLAAVEPAVRPVIHAGDRLVLEEHSAAAEARLAAVALDSAPAGSAFRARLQLGGKVVRAVALGTGRAAFQTEMEAGR
jgi:hypothetical protein